jgi:Ca2+/Na+ antiporter
MSTLNETPFKGGEDSLEIKILPEEMSTPDTCMSKDSCGKDPNAMVVPFWSNNPNILLNSEYLFELFPTEDMSFEQKLNAVSRMLVLLTIMTFLYTKSPHILLVGTVSVFFVYLLFKHKSAEKDEIKQKKEGFDDERNLDATTPAQTLYKVDKPMEVFQRPDAGNPFGNVLPTDYIYNPKRKPAPPSGNSNVAADIVEQAKQFVRNANPDQPDITEKLFKDLGDEYVFEQSLRPFNSTASTTIPNDQQSFSEFCYGGMVSCKEGNAFACAKGVARYNNY